MTNIYLDRRQAAKHLTERGLKTAATTLAKLATVGGGPTFRHFGARVVYVTEDLDTWAESKLSAPIKSTSGTPEAA